MSLVAGIPCGLNLAAKLKAHAWGAAVLGVVEDFVPGEVTVIADDAIAENTSLTVELNAFSFEGEVLSCRPRGARFELHVAIKDADSAGLRKTPRFPVYLPARVSSSCLGAPEPGTIIDISGDGLGLQTNVKLAKEAALAIESASNLALGFAKYSHEVSPGKYRTGVTLHHIIAKGLDGALLSVCKPSLLTRVSRFGRVALHALLLTGPTDHRR